MKKIFSTFFVSLFMLFGYSQTTFFKQYTYSNNAPGFAIKQHSNRNYSILYKSLDPNLTDLNFGFFELNSSGELVRKLSYTNFGVNYTEDFLIEGDEYKIAGVNQTTNGNYRKLFYSINRIDSNLNYYWFSQNNKSDNTCYQINKIGTDYYLIGNILIQGRSSEVNVVKLNSSGQQLWDKTYGTIKPDWARASIVTNDNCIVMVGGSYYGSNGDANVFLLKIDSAGNEIWSKEVNRDNDPNNECRLEGLSIIEASNGNYYIGGCNNTNCDRSSTYEPNNVSLLICLDSLGNHLWSREDHFFLDTIENGISIYEPQYINKIVETRDGNIVSANELTRDITGDTLGRTETQILLVKYDFNGSLVWQREYGDTTKIETLYDMIETIDKGFIICGRYANYDTPFDSVKAFALKVDECGCLVPGCDPNCSVTGFELISPYEFYLSSKPNPFTTTTNISYYLTRNSNVSLAVYDILGRKVYDFLINENQSAGKFSYELNSSYLQNKKSIYVVKLSVNGTDSIIKVLFN